MNIDDIIIDSANVGLSMVSDARFANLASNVVRLCIDELRKHVASADSPGILLTGTPRVIGEKDPDGCLLVMPGKTVLVWSAGLAGKRQGGAVLPVTAPDQIVQQAMIAKTWRQPEKFLIEIVGPPRYQMEFFNVGNMKGALNLARMTATGGVSFTS